MKTRLDQGGTINTLLIPLVICVVFLFGALGFGAWAFMEREDYKGNVDGKIDQAVATAVERAKSEKDNEFIEREKEPLKTYIGPESLGSINFKYPKTWSSYQENKDNELSVAVHPGTVPADSGARDSVSYALKVEVVNNPYANEVERIQGDVREGKAKVRAYRLPKLPDIVGIRVDGEIEYGKNGSAVYLPLRDKTIKITTFSDRYVGDFNKFILPNFTFRP